MTAYTPISPRFLEAMLPAITAGSVSCANCRHWRIGVALLTDDERIPVVCCSQNYYECRRIDKNVGPQYADVALSRAADCSSFDHMGEE